ncbi:Acetyltransferase (GNAT) domain-containing protein [Micromonospora echinaurantiaca]|uniref:Acetyltransferase (GNAT) domain-containing protein n=1 Tax=Micromonospora echinaurantiaca TaxID=47857 RepID=A0A1C5K422_9ACTN|nr:GNAT family N-acetyltransferase [Micromonospora echinaurantiaca]SCG77535.1 Acetyltransferase (GNAT) domain-containing protein [Micromonospora echinaurantiaca]
MRVTVRSGTAADAAALAGLRWRRVTEERGYTGTDRADFLAMFAAWAAEHSSSHLSFLAEVDNEVVGMAWLMVADRVPTPVRRHRRSGDVQSVYVVPELRDAGVGAILLEAVLAEAAKLELEQVTVHSTERAIPFYQRVGFQHDQRWLRWQPE